MLLCFLQVKLDSLCRSKYILLFMFSCVVRAFILDAPKISLLLWSLTRISLGLYRTKSVLRILLKKRLQSFVSFPEKIELQLFMLALYFGYFSFWPLSHFYIQMSCGYLWLWVFIQISYHLMLNFFSNIFYKSQPFAVFLLLCLFDELISPGFAYSLLTSSRPSDSLSFHAFPHFSWWVFLSFGKEHCPITESHQDWDLLCFLVTWLSTYSFLPLSSTLRWDWCQYFSVAHCVMKFVFVHFYKHQSSDVSIQCPFFLSSFHCLGTSLTNPLSNHLSWICDSAPDRCSCR